MMSRILQAVIPRRQRHCFACHQPFHDKQEYHSTLKEEENALFLRCDFCEPCYRNGVIKEKPAVVWRGVVVNRAVKKDPSTDRITYLLESLRDLLGKPNCAADAFFIALYLARRKVIIFRHEIISYEGKILWIYEVSATEEMITVEKVSLTNLQNAQLQKEVLELLQKKD